MTTQSTPDLDVLIVGAGFSGMYLIHRLRAQGQRVRAIEAGSDVGGTWYWNRYPGARVDIQSIEYSFSFDDDLVREWQWSERYAPQAELLDYARHIADRFDLRRDIQFNTRITAAKWHDEASHWHITTSDGETITARHFILATGTLSVPTDVTFPGIESFKGQIYRTSRWPHQGVDFTGQRVGIIGTGSSAIQSIPEIAKQAAHLTVFQRTPNYSMPACNGPVPADELAHWQADPKAFRAASKYTVGGFQNETREQALATETPQEEIEAELERRWRIGGFRILGAFVDQTIDERANKIIADFVANKIREQVKDPETAEMLIPRDHPFATKRPCVDTGYYATYNRDNVSLINLRATPIETFTAAGIATSDKEYAFDSVVLATGFDAMTGAVDRIDITGKNGLTMKQAWAEGPRTYLGLSVAGFPNMFIITGPGSPSVLTNMLNSIEQHVEWVSDCIVHLAASQQTSIEATPEAETAWVQHVQDAVAPTLFRQANSWYMGANVPGKPRMFMPYAGGLHTYTDICNAVRDKGYEGFTIRQGDQAQNNNPAFTSHPPMPDLPAPLMALVMERLGIAAE
jgi:cyclohexanone monooxygenase